MVDVTPAIPTGRQVIEAYGGGRFRIAGVQWRGSVLVFPTATLSWPVAAPEALTEEAFAPVVEAAAEVEVLLFGGGSRLVPLARDLRAILRSHGIVTEPMDTGAACRTFNVLLAEDRRVAAALIAVA